MTNARPFNQLCSQSFAWLRCFHAPDQGHFGEAVVAVFLKEHMRLVALIGGDEVRFRV